MSLLFVEGFDHYQYVDFNKKGWSVSNVAYTVVISTAGRRGGGALLAPANTSGNGYAFRAIPATTSFVIGFSFKTTGLPTAVSNVVRLVDDTTTQCELNLRTDGSLSVTRNGTALTGGVSTFVVGP